MKLLKKYFEIQKKIYDYFGYFEEWEVIPIEDYCEYFWRLDGQHVLFSEKKENIFTDDTYVCEIYQQRFLEKHIYRTDDFTMICVDTKTDGNKFLGIFDNLKEVKNEK